MRAFAVVFKQLSRGIDPAHITLTSACIQRQHRLSSLVLLNGLCKIGWTMDRGPAGGVYGLLSDFVELETQFTKLVDLMHVVVVSELGLLLTNYASRRLCTHSSYA